MDLQRKYGIEEKWLMLCHPQLRTKCIPVLIVKKEFKTSQALSMHKHWCNNLHHRTSPGRPPIDFERKNDTRSENFSMIAKSVVTKLIVDVEANEHQNLPDKRFSYAIKKKVEVLNDLNDGM